MANHPNRKRKPGAGYRVVAISLDLTASELNAIIVACEMALEAIDGNPEDMDVFRGLVSCVKIKAEAIKARLEAAGRMGVDT